MPKKEVLEATAKKDRLTLSQLAGYDDILTDALVDHVYFTHSAVYSLLANLNCRSTSGR